MGKRLDRWVLAGLLACALYLFFLNAWDSVPLACAAAFGCCLLARRAVRLLPKRRPAARALISDWLGRMSAMDEAQAQPELDRLIRRRYPGEDFELVPVLKHPEATLSCGDVLNAWKANRNADRLVVASTCPCEPRAAVYARQLQSPRVAIVDSRALARMVRACGVGVVAPTPVRPRSFRHRMENAATRLANARVSPRNALPAVALLGMYLLYGHGLYLFSALAILFHLGAGLLGGRARRRLFDQA